MEDDDEFGDLYTDVLQPFQMTSSSSAPPVESKPPPAPPPIGRSIDLNDRIPSDDEEILYGTKNSGDLKIDQKPGLNLNIESGGGRVLVKEEESKGFVKEEEEVNYVDEVKGEELMKFGIEEEEDDDDDANNVEFVIPGLSNSGVSSLRVAELKTEAGEGGVGDEWDDDSDSEDDLQIVLNDEMNGGGMMMGIGMEGGLEEDDDEDGDNLVIVEGDVNLQGMEEMQEWGEDGGQGGEAGGERKGDGGDGKGDSGGVGTGAQKIGYGVVGGHVYHSFHSQFKYVRPGAAPMPGAGSVATGGAPGQVRPPASMLPFAGRGRGEWRLPGIKNVPPNMQKSFHSGYGMPGWANNGAGRGFGSGLDFTLPSHKTIFEVDIDGFDEKPWRLQGIDISDFFNFGMNEESWREYCKQLEQHRMEATMQSKIRVYESGRTEQEYDPDLPPELAAAAGHDLLSENRNMVKPEVQNDLAKGSVQARTQLPTGKAIQVETSYSERLPSIDTRPPRMRDSDAIIEIVLQRSPDRESLPEDDVDAAAEHLVDIPTKESHREGPETEDAIGSEDDHFDKPHAYNGRKREGSGRGVVVIGSTHELASTGDRVSHFSETEVEDRYNSRGKTSSYPSKKHNSSRNHIERPMKRAAADRSPRLMDSGTPQDKIFNNQNDESTESVDRNQSLSSSPVTLGSAEDRSVDQNNGTKEDVIVTDGNTYADDTFKDEKIRHTMKKQKLITRVELSSVERGEDGEDSKAARSSENSKARSGSSKDMEHEVVQVRGSIYSGNIRKPANEDEHSHRTRGRDEKQERERHQMPMKGMEDPYTQRKWESNQGYRSHVKSENFDRKQGREPEGVWLEDMRKRSHDEEMVSRHRHKARENERSDKNEHRSRKPLENGIWKGDHDRDMIPQLKRDDGFKTRHNIPDGMHSKRETSIKESTSRRKRERDDILDQSKRDDEQHLFRYKEEGRLQREKVERQRERDEWKERDSHRGGHSRMKEDYRTSEKEYPFKEVVREPISRREKFENESVPRHRGREDAYAHGNKINNEERISRHDRGYTASSKDMHGVQEKKHKESVRKGKETDGGVHSSLATSRRNREDHISQKSERASSRGMLEQRSSDQNPMPRKSSKKHKENASSEDEQQESKKGRSKLERWTSHKDRDFNLPTKTSASLDLKETDRYNDNGPPSKPLEESSKPQEIIETPKPLAEEKNDDPKPEDKHLDTVEKLKKRSERFKLPMPSEKEALIIKKIENEPLPSVQPEIRPESDVKPERPARKRRWTSG
uniref:FIP1[V]-like protein n=1 Tax=Erigeron canadensis TaxID=72917 RepID=UPI001CB9B113|nr:FIP1[V]-like protein [Erigeron canadensis]